MSTVGDIMINVDGYLEYRGSVQYCRGYHKYNGVFSTVSSYLPMVLMISFHGTETPHSTQDITPTVLNIPNSIQDIPHVTHDILHGTEHPTALDTHYTR